MSKEQYDNRIMRRNESLETQLNSVAVTPAQLADRKNTGKPQFTYIFTFRNALRVLVNSTRMQEYTADEAIRVLQDYQHREESSDMLARLVLSTLQVLEDLLAHGDSVIDDQPSYDSLPRLITRYYAAWSEVAQVCMNGAIKYARDNYKHGLPVLSLLDCAYRHQLKFSACLDYDEEDYTDKQGVVHHFKTHHLAHVIWNLLVILEQLETHKRLDDRPYPPELGTRYDAVGDAENTSYGLKA